MSTDRSCFRKTQGLVVSVLTGRANRVCHCGLLNVSVAGLPSRVRQTVKYYHIIGIDTIEPIAYTTANVVECFIVETMKKTLRWSILSVGGIR